MGGLWSSSSKPVRYLGVLLDVGLRMTPHIKSCATKARARVNLLRRITSRKWGAERRSLRMLLEHWVRPVLEYGHELVLARGQFAMECLRMVMNVGVRACSGAPPSAGLDGLYAELGIENLRPRWVHLMAATASRLQRSEGSSTVSDHWLRWSAIREPLEVANKLEWDPRPHVGVSRVRGSGSRRPMGPFDTMWNCLVLFDLVDLDRPREPMDARAKSEDMVSRPPWEWATVRNDLGSITMSDKTSTLGSASGRTGDQLTAAREFSTRALKRMFEKTRDRDRELLLVYTDGSYDRDKRGGGAGVVWATTRDGVEVCVRSELRCPLGPVCSSYLAEQAATLYAARDHPIQVYRYGHGA